jgi:hypothetical protein
MGILSLTRLRGRVADAPRQPGGGFGNFLSSRGCALAKHMQDMLNHAVPIFQNIKIRKPQRQVTALGKPIIAPGIAHFGLSSTVRIAIDLDDQFGGRAHEVRDPWPCRCLPPDVEPERSKGTQTHPKHSLRFGETFSEGAGASNRHWSTIVAPPGADAPPSPEEGEGQERPHTLGPATILSSCSAPISPDE